MIGKRVRYKGIAVNVHVNPLTTGTIVRAHETHIWGDSQYPRGRPGWDYDVRLDGWPEGDGRGLRSWYDFECAFLNNQPVE